jgi:hypothetical protein
MGGVYLHSPNTPLWRGAQLGGARGQLYFTFIYEGSVLSLYTCPGSSCSHVVVGIF